MTEEVLAGASCKSLQFPEISGSQAARQNVDKYGRSDLRSLQG